MARPPSGVQVIARPVASQSLMSPKGFLKWRGHLAASKVETAESKSLHNL